MRPIDEYIVRMQLDNEKFKRNAKESIGIFESMKSLFGKTTPTHSLESIGSGMDTLISKFDTGSVMFRRVLDNMVDAAMNAGRKMASAITTPLVQAGKNRALSIEQAKFQFQGLGMDVDATMESANQAVLGTAFGLDEAAMAAAMFGASGMRAGDEMTTALRGISGVAAMTGSSYSDISNVFTSVAGNGRLMGNDLLRLSTRGVNAAATLADAMGTTEGAVREMVTAGEIDFATFAGAMDDAFGEHATKSSETFKGALSLVNSAIGRIGATMFAQGFVDKKNLFNAMTPQVNDLHTALKPLINTFNEYKSLVTGRLIADIEKINLKPLIQSTKEFTDQGGMKVITDSFDSLLNVAQTVTRSIKHAMGRVFDGPTVSGTIGFLEGFQKAFASLEKFALKNADNITNAFEGVFAMLDLGWYIVKELGKVFLDLFPSSLGDTVFDVAGGFGEMATAFASSVKEGSLLPAVLEGISTGLGFVKTMVEKLGGGVKTVFKGITPVLEFIWELLKKIGSFAKGIFKDVFGEFDGMDLMTIGTATGILSIVKRVGEYMDKLLGIVRDTGLASSIESITNSFTGMLDSVTDSLTAMTNSVKAKNLLTIATAVGILAVSLKLFEGMALSDIGKGLGAVAGALIIMTGALKLISKIDIGGIQSLTNTTALIGLATATVIMASAIKKVSDIDEADLGKGIGGLVVAVGLLVGAMKLLSMTSGIEVGAAKMIAISVSIRILVGALKPISEMDTRGLSNGLSTIGLLLLEMAAFAKLTSKTGISPSTALGVIMISGAMVIMVKALKGMVDIDTSGLLNGVLAIGSIMGIIVAFSKLVNPVKLVSASGSMVIISVALIGMSKAVGNLGNLDQRSLVNGVTAIGILLLEIVAFSKIVDPGKMTMASVSMVILAGAINMLAKPIKELGEMASTDLLKGVAALGVTVGGLVLAMNLSKGGIAGAGAMVVMAGALNLMVIPIEKLGNMNMEDLVQGLLGLAGTMVIMGGLSAILGPLSPVIFTFAASLAAVGLAVALAGVGLSAIASAIKAMADTSTKALESVVELMVIFLDGLAEIMPKVVMLIINGITELVVGIAEATPVLANAGMTLIIGLLEVIRDRVPEFITVSVEMVLAIVEGIEDNAEILAEAGINLIISLMDAMSNAMEEHGPTLIASIMRFVGELLIIIVEAGTQVISALFGWIPGVNEAMDVVGAGATEAIREAFDAGDVGTEKGEEFAGAVTDTHGDAYKAGHGLGEEGEKGAGDTDWGPAGVESALEWLQGLSSEERAAALAGKNLSKSGYSGSQDTDFSPAGRMAGQGFIRGLSARDLLSGVWTAGKNLASRALSAMKKTLDTGSPSKKTAEIGGWFGDGLVIGMEDSMRGIGKAGSEMAEQAMDAVKSKADMFAELLNKEMDLSPRVTPILDMGDFNTDDLDNVFERYVNTSNSRYRDVESRSNQNGNIRNNNVDKPIEYMTPVEYHAHLTVQGSLPTSTINRMAKDFDNALKDMEDSHKMARGEKVVY